MMRILLVTVFLIGTSSLSHAQRYLPNQKGVQITGGIVDVRTDSYHLGIAYTEYNHHRNRWTIGAEFLNRENNYSNKKIPVNQFVIEAGYYKKLFSDRRDIFFFSMGLSALGGYESINWNKHTLFDGARIEDRGRFVYGGALSFELEAFLSDRIALLLNLRERCLFGGDTDKLHNQIGFGIKYILN